MAEIPFHILKRAGLFFLFLAVCCYHLSAQSRADRQKFYQQSPQPAPAPIMVPNPFMPGGKAPLQVPTEPQRKLPALPPQPAMPPVDAPFEPDLNAAIEYSTRLMRDGWAHNSRPVGIGQLEFADAPGYMGVWGAYDFNDRLGRQWRFEEARFYGGITLPLQKFPFDIPAYADFSWSYLAYPGRHEQNSQEWSFSIFSDGIFQGESWKIGGRLTVIYDSELGEKAVSLATNYQRKITADGRLGWDLQWELHWGDNDRMTRLSNENCASNAFYATVVRAGLEWAITPQWILRPAVGISAGLDQRARHALKEDWLNSAAMVWGSLRLTRTF